MGNGLGADKEIGVAKAAPCLICACLFSGRMDFKGSLSHKCVHDDIMA